MYVLFPLSRSSNQIVEIEESDGEGEGEGPEVVELFQFGTSAELTQKAEAKASFTHTIHPYYNQRKGIYKEQRAGPG